MDTKVVRKPLGVRVTPEQHRILKSAAEREHRSVSSFVLRSALHEAEQKEASAASKPRWTSEEAQAWLRTVREQFKKATPEGRDLAEELIAERRAEAARE